MKNPLQTKPGNTIVDIRYDIAQVYTLQSVDSVPSTYRTCDKSRCEATISPEVSHLSWHRRTVQIFEAGG